MSTFIAINEQLGDRSVPLLKQLTAAKPHDIMFTFE